MSQLKNTTFVVLTTINKVSKNILNIEKNCKKKKWNLIIVGDKKTPKNFNLNYGHYYNLQEQSKLNFKYEKNAVLNNYARKNIAYLVSIKKKADIIIETDDDNYPLKNFFVERKKFHKYKKIINKGWINIYDIFKKDKKSIIWQRGLPLQNISNNEIIRFKNNNNDCFVHQGLCNLNPDVDAIYRLINKNINIRFKDNLNIGISSPSITSFNSQNTTWFKEAFPLLYLPTFCSMRATDIWRSIITQKILFDDKKTILFHSSNVYQKRNPHNLMVDFKDEVPVYLDVNKLYELLRKIKIKKGSKNYLNNLVKCYEVLCEERFFKENEFKLVKSWEKDIQTYLT
jgi:hypothetical protein